MYYTVMKPCKAGKDNLEMLQYQKTKAIPRSVAEPYIEAWISSLSSRSQ